MFIIQQPVKEQVSSQGMYVKYFSAAQQSRKEGEHLICKIQKEQATFS